MLTEMTSRIEFQMSLLLFVSLAGYIIASRINQSAVIGEILIGLIIGPSLLGLITYTDFVASIAHLGAVILLFVVGLEFRIKDIFKLKYAPIALAGVIVPWLGGYFIAALFGYDFGSAVFVGTALTATSIAITANVLRELGQLQTEVAKAIIGAAVIDDILGLLALSMSEQIVTGSLSFVPLLEIFLTAVIFLIGGLYVGSQIFNKIILKIDETEIAQKFPEFVFIFAMMLAFCYALVAEIIHLSAIVGSFVAGVSLVGVVLRHSKDYKIGAEYLHIIFASIFFVSLGILVDIRALNGNVFVFLLCLIVVAVLTKVIGCFIPAKLQGFTIKDSLILGFGMSPRGEVAMIVALIGLNAGLIGQDIYSSLVIMSLLTTVITPIVLQLWLDKKAN